MSTDLTDLPPPAMIRRAGWLPDPSKVSDERYWDGRAWTDLTREHKQGGVSALTFWGIIAGLLLPIVGAVIAIVLLARSQVGPGLAVLLTSGLGFVIALAYLGS